jgi:hypothetical protein
MKIFYGSNYVAYYGHRDGYARIDRSGEVVAKNMLAYDLCALLALADEVFGREVEVSE